jgi:hypothetical protein
MTDKPDPAAVLAALTALSKARQADRLRGAWPDSLVARIRECEQLADMTNSPMMSGILRKLAKAWREMATLLPPSR